MGIPEVAGFILTFVVGTCIGSFLNVVIYRVPDHRSLMTGSACPNCSAPIKFYYNIPIVGWLMLGGKCSDCKAPIAWRYPAVELLTGLLFILTYSQIGLTPFLAVARKRGHRTVNGLGMLLSQGRPAWKAWFGIEPEVTSELRAMIEKTIPGA